ncbi:MAG TPA: DUF2530 domain-containing protein [Corynebacteriales bacterium]|nr:DUF2530 domain-containing protein [Mycobacteriales bacterium]
MAKRTIPTLPAGLIDPRPVIGAGTGAWVVVLIVSLVMKDYGLIMWTAICGLIFGAALYGVFAWQRNAVRRGKKTAQTSLPDVRRNGDAEYDEVIVDVD